MIKKFPVLIGLIILSLSISGCLGGNSIVPEPNPGVWSITPNRSVIELNEVQLSAIVTLNIQGYELSNRQYDVNVYMDVFDTANWGNEGLVSTLTILGVGGSGSHLVHVPIQYLGPSSASDVDDTAIFTIKVFGNEGKNANGIIAEGFTTLKYVQRGRDSSSFDYYDLHITNPNEVQYTISGITLSEDITSNEGYAVHQVLNGTYTVTYDGYEKSIIINGNSVGIDLGSISSDLSSFALMSSFNIVWIIIIIVILIFFVILWYYFKGGKNK